MLIEDGKRDIHRSSICYISVEFMWCREGLRSQHRRADIFTVISIETYLLFNLLNDGFHGFDHFLREESQPAYHENQTCHHDELASRKIRQSPCVFDCCRSVFVVKYALQNIEGIDHGADQSERSQNGQCNIGLESPGEDKELGDEISQSR